MNRAGCSELWRANEYFFCTNFLLQNRVPHIWKGKSMMYSTNCSEQNPTLKEEILDRMCAITSMHKFLFIRHDWLPKSASKRLRSWALWHFSCFMSVTLFRLMLCCSNSTLWIPTSPQDQGPLHSLHSFFHQFQPQSSFSFSPEIVFQHSFSFSFFHSYISLMYTSASAMHSLLELAFFCTCRHWTVLHCLLQITPTCFYDHV